MQTAFDAIIVGAGPAGSSAAILLAQAGWSVALIEKHVFPRRKVCGECIAAPNLVLLDALGIGEEFHQLAGPELRQVAIMSGRKTIIADLPPLSTGPQRWGRALGREHLDTLLLGRAKSVGATVMQPWTVASISGSPGRFECSATGSAQTITLTAPIIIAAYGSWELTPPERGIERLPRKAQDLFGFKANFTGSNLDAGLLPVLAFDGGYGGMVLGDHGVTTLACCIRRDVLSAYRQRFQTHTAAEAVEAYLKASCVGVEQTLLHAQQQDSWLSIGPLRTGIRIRRSDNRFFLVGNAAGEAHPIIGEGISMALQASWILCDRLIRNKHELSDAATHESIRQQYVDHWICNFAPRIRLAAMFAHIAMRPAASAAVLPLLQLWPHFITYGAKVSGKVADEQLLSLRPLR